MLLVAALGTLHAAGLPGGGEPKLLPPEQAFRLSARALDPATIEARFDVADGYYLYRDKLRFTIEPVGALPANLPPGKRKHDEFFGDVETYRGRRERPVDAGQIRARRNGDASRRLARLRGCGRLLSAQFAAVEACHPGRGREAGWIR